MEMVDSGLRYIEAEHVRTPSGRLEGTVLLSPRERTVGKLDGIVIDPVGRHVRYFVVRSRAWLKPHLHLVPVTPARLDADQRALHVDIEPDDLARFQEVQPDTFPRYSDDDLLAAVFPSAAA